MRVSPPKTTLKKKNTTYFKIYQRNLIAIINLQLLRDILSAEYESLQAKKDISISQAQPSLKYYAAFIFKKPCLFRTSQLLNSKKAVKRNEEKRKKTEGRRTSAHAAVSHAAY